jgi:chromosome segregation ATPase
LNKVLVERERQLLEVKTQLQEAVKEMEEATELIQKMKTDKNDDDRKIVDLLESTRELKKQLNVTHERCQDLQEELTCAEKLIEKKDNDVGVLQCLILSLI